VEAAGAGPSLEKLDATAFGNDPSAWRASPGESSPGLENLGNRRPTVDAGADIALVSTSFPMTMNLTGTAMDDGLPLPSLLHYAWSQESGPGVVQIENGDQATATFLFPGVGEYQLKLSVSDGELTGSDTVTISITRPLSQETFIAKGSTWKYLDNGSDQKSAWAAAGFNDSAWNSGGAQLGYGDGDETTTLSYGPNSGSKFITTYFRKGFVVNGARNVTSLSLNLLRDDGAVVYLNGVEVMRDNMPQGAVNYLTHASTAIGGGDESTYYTTVLDPSALVEGNNVIAVELHQSGGTSTDISFDLELSGMANFSNEAPLANAGPDQVVTLPSSAQLTGIAADDGLPIPPGVFTASWSIVSGPGNVSFASGNLPETSASFSEAGDYTLRLTVTDGEFASSDEVKVTVNGGDPYLLWRNQHFTSAEQGDPAISGETADPDGDSFTNREEFIAGTDPKNGESFLHVITVRTEGEEFMLQFKAVSGKSYSIEGRDDLGSGGWTHLLDVAPQGATGVMEVSDPALGTWPNRYYRITTPREGQPN
jgi:hypothetical protein